MSLPQEEGCCRNDLHQPTELWPYLGDRGCLSPNSLGPSIYPQSYRSCKEV